MWSFDENGDTSLKTISGSIVHDGKFQFVKMLGDTSAESDGEPPAKQPAQPADDAQSRDDRRADPQARSRALSHRGSTR